MSNNSVEDWKLIHEIVRDELRGTSTPEDAEYLEAHKLEWKIALAEIITSINTQLTANKSDSIDGLIEEHDFRSWRKRALFFKMHCETRIKRIRHEIHLENQKKHAEAPSGAENLDRHIEFQKQQREAKEARIKEFQQKDVESRNGLLNEIKLLRETNETYFKKIVYLLEQIGNRA